MIATLTTLLGIVRLLVCAEPDPEVTWVPQQPAQGTAFIVLVRPDPTDSSAPPIDSVMGMVAGQPLHFEPTSDGRFWALSAVPLESQDTLPLTMTLSRARGRSEHVFVHVPVTRVRFPVESLRVDPRFTQRPDSALAARIAREFAAAAEVSRRTHRTPRLWHGGFERPVPDRVTSSFGMGREFNGELRSRHMGVDLDAAAGAPIRASNRGVVALVGDFYYAGRVIYVDHGRGLVTIYMHMSRVDVAEGDTVATGQVIGRVGASGRVTGPHLHWTARYGSVSLDPLTLLDLRIEEVGN